MMEMQTNLCLHHLGVVKIQSPNLKILDRSRHERKTERKEYNCDAIV